MSYTVEKAEKSQVKMVFDITAETFSKAVEEAYQKTKHKFAIAGFRKGHVPKKVIEGIYGKEVFFEDAMDIVIPEAYGEALQKEEEIEVVAQPELTAFDFKEDGGATFTLVVTVKPEVKLGAYKGLSVEKKAAKVTAKDVDEEIETARQKQARLIDVDVKAKSGDVVNIDFEGSVDGVKFDGGSAEKYDLELGSGSFIPGFEEQLIDTKSGDSKDVKVVFPEDYNAEELKGKEAVFKCKVNSVKVKEIPELDDEFAKEISEFDTLAAYKEDIKNKLTADAEEKAERDYEDAIVDKIVASSEVEIPEAMVVAETEDMVGVFEYRLMYQGIKLDDYLKYVNMTKEKLQEEYKPQAEKSVKVRLVMEAIVKAEDLKFEDAEIQAKIEKAATESGKSVDEFKKTMKKEQIDFIVNQILSEKLMALLKAENTATVKTAKKAVDKAEKAVDEKKPVAEKKAKAVKKDEE
ncbi:MAG: trigger factor [Clostridia bacterium]